MVLLNAAAALANVEGSLEIGLKKAQSALENGAALAKLDSLIAYTQNIAVES